MARGKCHMRQRQIGLDSDSAQDELSVIAIAQESLIANDCPSALDLASASSDTEGMRCCMIMSWAADHF